MNDSLLDKDEPFNDLENLTSSSQELRLDITGTTRRREIEMKSESLNTSTHLPHFQSRRGMLNQNGGTYSHSGMMDYPRIPVPEWNLEKFPDSMEFFKAGKSTSRLKYVQRQQILSSQCTGSMKLRLLSQLTNL